MEELRAKLLNQEWPRGSNQKKWKRFSDSLAKEVHLTDLYAENTDLRRELKSAGGICKLWCKIWPESAKSLESTFGPFKVHRRHQSNVCGQH